MCQQWKRRLTVFAVIQKISECPGATVLRGGRFPEGGFGNRCVKEPDGLAAAGTLSASSRDVLAGVITECKKQELPELTSLVVGSSDGMVGSGFNAVFIRSGRQSISDP